MHPIPFRLTLGLLSLVTCGVIGCGGSAKPTPPAQTENADPDDVHITADDVARPADFAAGVERVIAYRDKIRDEIAAKRPSKAHRPLDEATFVLDWLPELARASNVPKDKWETINTSAQEIRKLLDQIHERIDNKEEPDFAAVSDGLQKAIELLTDISTANEAGEAKPAPKQGEAGDTKPEPATQGNDG